MDARARRALETIRGCVGRGRWRPVGGSGRYRLLTHFTQRMDECGLFWPDVLAIIDAPAGVRSGGADDFGRPKWLVSGPAADGTQLELVCAIDRDRRGRVTVFITIY